MTFESSDSSFVFICNVWMIYIFSIHHHEFLLYGNVFWYNKCFCNVVVACFKYQVHQNSLFSVWDEGAPNFILCKNMFILFSWLYANKFHNITDWVSKVKFELFKNQNKNKQLDILLCQQQEDNFLFFNIRFKSKNILLHWC